MAFWKRKKEPEFISLGLNRAATAEEEAIAARRDEGPEPEFYEKFADAVASTRESIAERIDSGIGGRREIDADVLDELEEALIGADIGAQTSFGIIEKARQQISRKQLSDVDQERTQRDPRYRRAKSETRNSRIRNRSASRDQAVHRDDRGRERSRQDDHHREAC
jgi:signal recognition particle GTPase